jgi:signal transduction histidine kinase
VLAERLLPIRLVEAVPGSVLRYLALFAVVNVAMGGVFWLIHFQSTIEHPAIATMLSFEFWKLYVILFILAGIVTWLFVLAQESRDLAEEEARRHTRLLLDEIKAHEETDRQLQKAKEVAESANLAKSKYVVGLSHELRTPLTAILGYAQVLERVQGTPNVVHNAARTIKRSGEHLADMIEGLLDISKIEAGKLEIYRHKIALGPFLDQIVDMFSLQAKAKGVDFEFHAAAPLPDYVYTDEKRLRQVLINLLSNAIKFTTRGRVCFSVSYRNQVATFKVEDTGIGIRDTDVERIFLPFERAEQPAGEVQPPGTGLGLTITKLLVDIMGGDLTLDSRYGQGTNIMVRLMLSEAVRPEDKAGPALAIAGYEGLRRTILIADDDPTQRHLMEEVLTPLGFAVIAANDGPACLSSLALHRPDIVILDLGMPKMSGWEVARRIRQRHGRELPILILSADAGHDRTKPDYAGLFDSYLIKPFGFDELFERLAALIPLTWILDDGTVGETRPPPVFKPSERPDPQQLRQLKTLAEIGFVRSIDAMLNDIEISSPHAERFCKYLRQLATNYRLRELVALIEDAKDHV